MEPVEAQSAYSPTVPNDRAGLASGSEAAEGRLIGRYELLRLLGSGGMASVYLAYDPTLRRQVAVKFMLPGLARQVDFRRRFEREAAVVARLKHPRIVTVHESGRTSLDGDDVPYLVMEYIEGETLAQRVQRLGAGGERMPVLDALELTAQVLDALAYTHGQGVIHRDIKPGNVMIASDGSIKVMDFGIARLAVPDATKLTQSGALLGTPHYIAPEQIAGREAEPASDLYAVGTMLFELLAGKPPFPGGSPAEVLYAIAHTPPPDLETLRPDVGLEVAQVVRQALNKRPHYRPAGAQVMASRLREIAEQHRGGTLLAPDPWEPDPPADRRHVRLRPRPARPGAARRRGIRLAALAAVIAVAALMVSAEGWPLGVRPVAAQAHPAGWRPWRAKTSGARTMIPGVGSQSSKLFVGTTTGLLAIDRDTGRRLWSFDSPTNMNLDFGESAPAVSTDAVYVASESTVYALSASDGRLRWRRKLLADLSSAGISVAVGGGGVFIETPDVVLRVDPATGATQWQWRPNNCGMMPGAVFTATSDVLLAACSSPARLDILEAIDTRRGGERWRHPVSELGMPRILHAGSQLFFLGPSEPRDNNHLATSLDLHSGALLWQHEVGTYAVLDYVDHRLWQWSDNQLAVLNPATGQTTRTLTVPAFDTFNSDSQRVLTASADLIVLGTSTTVYAYHSSSGGQAWHYHAAGLAGLLADNALVLLTGDGPVAIDAINGAGPCNVLYCPGQL